MSEGRRRFSDLTKLEKVWVVGGTAEGLFVIAISFLLYQFFMVEDGPPFHIVGLMNAGRVLAAFRVSVASLYPIALIPAVVLFVPIFCYFASQSVSDTLKLIVFGLALLSVPMLFSLAVLSFLDLFFSTAPVAFQTILAMLTIFSSLAVFIRMLKFKKVQALLKFHQPELKKNIA